MEKKYQYSNNKIYPRSHLFACTVKRRDKTVKNNMMVETKDSEERQNLILNRQNKITLTKAELQDYKQMPLHSLLLPVSLDSCLFFALSGCSWKMFFTE